MDYDDPFTPQELGSWGMRDFLNLSPSPESHMPPRASPAARSSSAPAELGPEPVPKSIGDHLNFDGEPSSSPLTLFTSAPRPLISSPITTPPRASPAARASSALADPGPYVLKFTCEYLTFDGMPLPSSPAPFASSPRAFLPSPVTVPDSPNGLFSPGSIPLDNDPHRFRFSIRPADLFNTASPSNVFNTSTPANSSRAYHPRFDPEHSPRAEPPPLFGAIQGRSLDWQDQTGASERLMDPGRGELLEDELDAGRLDFSESDRLKARGHPYLYDKHGRFNPINPELGIRVLDTKNPTSSLGVVPQRCINCLGPISRTPTANDPDPDFQLSGHLPHSAVNEDHVQQSIEDDNNLEDDSRSDATLDELLSDPASDQNEGKYGSEEQMHNLHDFYDEDKEVVEQREPASFSEADDEDDEDFQPGTKKPSKPANKKSQKPASKKSSKKSSKPPLKKSGPTSKKSLPPSAPKASKKHRKSDAESSSDSEFEDHHAPTSKKSVATSNDKASRKRPAPGDLDEAAGPSKPAKKAKHAEKAALASTANPSKMKPLSGSGKATAASSRKAPASASTVEAGPSKKRPLLGGSNEADPSNPAKKPKKPKKERAPSIYDSETGEKLRQGQWSRRRIRHLSEIVHQVFNGSNTFTTQAARWEHISQRFYDEHPEYYKGVEYSHKVPGGITNIWNRRGRELEVKEDFDERGRKKNPSLATSLQLNRKSKKLKNQSTPQDQTSAGPSNSAKGKEPDQSSGDHPDSDAAQGNEPDLSQGNPPDLSLGDPPNPDLTQGDPPEAPVPPSADDFFDVCFWCGEPLEGRTVAAKNKHYQKLCPHRFV